MSLKEFKKQEQRVAKVDASELAQRLRAIPGGFMPGVPGLPLDSHGLFVLVEYVLELEGRVRDLEAR